MYSDDDDPNQTRQGSMQELQDSDSEENEVASCGVTTWPYRFEPAKLVVKDTQEIRESESMTVIDRFASVSEIHFAR